MQKFRLISGGKDRKTEAADADGAWLQQKFRGQLSFPATLNQEMPKIISIGFNELSFNVFSNIIESMNVRHIFDIRSLASFRDHGFSRQRTHDLFVRTGVQYEWSTAISDTLNISEGHDYNSHQPNFPTDSVKKITKCVSYSTVLIMSRTTQHFGTEREALVNYIFKSINRAELITFTPQWYPISISHQPHSPSVATPPATNRKPKSRREHNAQLNLPIPYDNKSDLTDR